MTDKKKTETVTIQEINFDAWETDNLLVSGGHEWHDGSGTADDVITVGSDTPLSSYGTDVITVNLEDLKEMELRSNGITQGDLFNGWPEDGDPVTITVNKNYDDE